MKSKKAISNITIIYGIIVSLLLFLVFIPKTFEQLEIKGFLIVMKEIGELFLQWNDLYVFFLIYLVAYVIIWWKLLWGSIIIIVVSLLAYLTIPLSLVITVPTSLVGVLYVLNWIIKR